MDIEFATRCCFSLNKKQRDEVERHHNRQKRLAKKVQDLGLYESGARRCCHRMCAMVLGTSLLKAARKDYAKIQSGQEQSSFLFSEFRDDASPNGFSCR